MSHGSQTPDTARTAVTRESGRHGVDATPVPDGRQAGTAGPVLDADRLTDERLTAQVLTKSTRENFPVATRLLPARLRRDLLAVYGFARLVDDLGDEAPGDRERLLDAVEDDLARIYQDGERPRFPILRDLAGTVQAHQIPAEPFRRLIAANRQDQKVGEYPTYADLVDYCTLSADPVGRIVLHVFDVATPERVALSDRICTALQLAEHIQDTAEDLRRGRVYLPAEDLRRFGCDHADLGLPVAPARVRRLIAFQRRRARALLDSGTPLVGTLPALARLAVAGYVAGGRAALAAVAAAGDDVLATTPRPARSVLLHQWLVVAAGGGAR